MWLPQKLFKASNYTFSLVTASAFPQSQFCGVKMKSQNSGTSTGIWVIGEIALSIVIIKVVTAFHLLTLLSAVVLSYCHGAQLRFEISMHSIDWIKLFTIKAKYLFTEETKAVNKMVNGLYPQYSAFLVLSTTQSALQYKPHLHNYTVPLYVLPFQYHSHTCWQFEVQYLVRGYFDQL